MPPDPGADPHVCSPQIARRPFASVSRTIPAGLQLVRLLRAAIRLAPQTLEHQHLDGKVSKSAPRSGSESDLSPDHKTNAASMAANTKSMIIPADSAIVAPMGNPINALATPSRSNATSHRPKPTVAVLRWVAQVHFSLDWVSVPSQSMIYSFSEMGLAVHVPLSSIFARLPVPSICSQVPKAVHSGFPLTIVVTCAPA